MKLQHRTLPKFQPPSNSGDGKAREQSVIEKRGAGLDFSENGKCSGSGISIGSGDKYGFGGARITR